MKLDVRAVLADAWAMWRTDRELLFRIMAAFFFLPQFGMLLMLPAMPILAVTPEMSEADQLALANKIMAWVSAYGGWYLAGAIVVQAGSLVVLMLYLQRDRPILGDTIRRSLWLFPRYLLAMILVGMPLGIGVLTFVLLLPAFYLAGRLIAVGPVLAGEQPMSVTRSLSRSWALTRGNGFALAALASLTILGGAILAAPFTLIDKSLRADAPNQIAIALADAGAAAVMAIALLATILVQIAAYRRLVASKGM